MWIRTIITGGFVLVASGAAMAQGVFDFDDIPGVDEEPAVSVDLNSALLGFIRGMLGDVDPTTADILSGLRSIRVRVYKDADKTSQFSNFMDKVSEELDDSGWQSMVRVDDQRSKVRIHMQMTEQEVTGMTVMLFDGKEAVFINIDGTINAADLGKLMATLQQGGMMPPIPSLPGAAKPVGAPTSTGSGD
jgi:hypothetical protein